MSSRSGVLAVTVLALALIEAASGGMGGAAAAASAPAPTLSPMDTITIVSASTTVVTGGEELSVTADSTTPIVTMKAHLINAATNIDTLDLPMQPPAGGAAAGQSTWTATFSESTPPPGLPPGTYYVTVDAADQGGTTVTGVPAATTPSVTLSVDNSVVSYDHQHPTISGKVTVLLPGATAPTPYANQQIVLEDSHLGRVNLTTDASGGYVHMFLSPQPGETVSVAVPPSATVAAASSPNTVTFTTHTDQVKLSASLSAKTITYGSKVTVKGTVTYAPGSTFVPLPGQTVRIYSRASSNSPVATAVTGGTGNFTAALPKESASVRWVLRVGGPYLNTATSTLPMKVNMPTAVTGFAATLNQFWQVSFHGCLALPAGVPGYVPSLAGLTIQYAAHSNGPWHTLGAPVASQRSFACGNDGRTFSGTLPARLNYAYYRAVYAGGADHTGTGYLPSASGTVLAWKYEDRITSFTVSKRSVSKGGKLTVTGRLQYYLAKWRDFPGQQVLIILRPQGSKAWYWIAVARANSAGYFSVTFTDPVSATWSAEYLGNSAHLATVAAMIYVRVTR